MATQTRVNERIDLKLNAVAAEFAGLPATAEDWPHMLDDHQAAFLLEWDELMARMESLDREFHSRGMTSAQQHAYRTLLTKLRDVLPLVERLNLPKPRIGQVL